MITSDVDERLRNGNFNLKVDATLRKFGKLDVHDCHAFSMTIWFLRLNHWTRFSGPSVQDVPQHSSVSIPEDVLRDLHLARAEMNLDAVAKRRVLDRDHGFAMYRTLARSAAVGEIFL